MAIIPTFGEVRIETLDNTGFKVRAALNNFPYGSYSFGWLISTVNKDPKFAVNDNVHTPTPEANTTKYKISYQDSGLENAEPFTGGFYDIVSGNTVINYLPVNFDLGIDLLGLLETNKTYYIKPYATLLWVDTYYGKTSIVRLPGEFEIKSDIVGRGMNDVTLQASIISSNGDGVGERGWLFSQTGEDRLKVDTWDQLNDPQWSYNNLWKVVDPKVGSGISSFKKDGLPMGTPHLVRYYAVNTSYVPYKIQFGKVLEFVTKPDAVLSYIMIHDKGVSENKEARKFYIASIISEKGGKDAEVYVKLYAGSETVPSAIPADAKLIGKHTYLNDGATASFDYMASTLGLTTGSYILAVWIKNPAGTNKEQLRFMLGGGELSPYLIPPMAVLDAYKIDDFVGLYAKIVSAGSYMQSYKLELLTSAEELVSLFLFDGLNENGMYEFNKNLGNLPASTSYIFRLTLKTDYTEEQGQGDFVIEDTFTTNAIPASATIALTDITDITKTSAKVSAEVTTAGGYEITDTGIIYSISPINALTDGTKKEGFAGNKFDVTIEELTPGTLYYVRPYVGTTFGNQGTFTTEVALVPTATVVLNPITFITASTAKAKALITRVDGYVVTAAGIIYDRYPITHVSNGITKAWVSGDAIDADLTNLSPNTLYYVRPFVDNIFGPEITFTTKAIVPSASIVLNSITEIKKTNAWAMATIAINNGYVITAAGIIYSTSEITALTDGTKKEWVAGNTFAPTLDNLTPGTLYYVRPYLDGVLGNQLTFTTLADDMPSVTVELNPITNITKNTASVTAKITALGGYAVTSGGIRYSTTAINAITDGSSGGVWTSGDKITAEIASLMAETLYYVRPFVNNVLGPQKTFTTLAAGVTNPAITLTKTKVQENKYTIGIATTSTPESKGIIYSKISNPEIGSGTMVNYTTNTQDIVFYETTTYYIKAWMIVGGVKYYSAQTTVTITTVLNPSGFPMNPYMGMEWTMGTQTWVWNGEGWAKKKASGAPEQEVVASPVEQPVIINEYNIELENFKEGNY